MMGVPENMRSEMYGLIAGALLLAAHASDVQELVALQVRNVYFMYMTACMCMCMRTCMYVCM